MPPNNIALLKERFWFGLFCYKHLAPTEQGIPSIAQIHRSKAASPGITLLTIA